MLAWKIRGQKVSKQDIRVEQKVSVALLASRYDSCLRGGSEDETIADSREGGSECKLRRKVTCGGVCDVSGIMLRLMLRLRLRLRLMLRMMQFPPPSTWLLPT